MTTKLLNSILAISSNVGRGFLWMSIIKLTGKELYGDITTLNTALAYMSIFIGLEVFRAINRPLLDNNKLDSFFLIERLIVTFFLAGLFTYIILKTFPVTGDFRIVYALLVLSMILENINVELGRLFNFQNLYLPPTIGNSFLTLFVPIALLLFRIDSVTNFLLTVFVVGLLRFFWFLSALYYFKLLVLFKSVTLNFSGLISKYKSIWPFLFIACFEALLPIFDRIMLKKHTEILGLFNLFTMMFALAPLVFDSYFVYPQFKQLKKRFVDDGDKHVLKLPMILAVLLFIGLAAGLLMDDLVHFITGERLRRNLNLIIFVILMILLNSLKGFAYLLFYFAEKQIQYISIYVSIEILYVISIMTLAFSGLDFRSYFFILNIFFNSTLITLLYYKLAK